MFEIFFAYNFVNTITWVNYHRFSKTFFCSMKLWIPQVKFKDGQYWTYSLGVFRKRIFVCNFLNTITWVNFHRFSKTFFVRWSFEFLKLSSKMGNIGIIPLTESQRVLRQKITRKSYVYYWKCSKCSQNHFMHLVAYSWHFRCLLCIERCMKLGAKYFIRLTMCFMTHGLRPRVIITHVEPNKVLRTRWITKIRKKCM